MTCLTASIMTTIQIGLNALSSHGTRGQYDKRDVFGTIDTRSITTHAQEFIEVVRGCSAVIVLISEPQIISEGVISRESFTGRHSRKLSMLSEPSPRITYPVDSSPPVPLLPTIPGSIIQLNETTLGIRHARQNLASNRRAWRLRHHPGDP